MFYHVHAVFSIVTFVLYHNIMSSNVFPSVEWPDERNGLRRFAVCSGHSTHWHVHVQGKYFMSGFLCTPSV